ncbi:hypothetical protein [Streptomyces cyaneofuscatus]|uniref:hypothetical protein n=1 Tax=Streptomyces cyaneofuscatus TaxID=66883 RepID=UPI003668EF4F
MTKFRVLLRSWLDLQDRYLFPSSFSQHGSGESDTVHSCSEGPNCTLAKIP